MLQRCKTNGFHRRSGIVNANVAAFAWSPLFPLTAACTVALDAAAAVAAEVNVQFESAPRMCFASQALQQRVCPCVCARVGVCVYIDILWPRFLWDKDLLII